MKKILIAVALMFGTGLLGAEEAKSWKSWYSETLRGLKTKISKKLQSNTRVSAVAAVRGKLQGASDPNALYWKGGVSEKAAAKLAEEQKQLTEAVQLVVDGDVPGGRAALKKFLADNPESFFAQDAKDALANLPAEEAKPEAPAAAPAAAKEEAKPEPKPEPKSGSGN